MFLNRFFILIFPFFLVTECFAEEITADTTEKSSIFVLCKRGKEVRWLRAFKTDIGKCKTHYSKEGYLQIISSATFFSSCEAVLENVKKNLEEGSFKCTSREVLSIDEIQ